MTSFGKGVFIPLDFTLSGVLVPFCYIVNSKPWEHLRSTPNLSLWDFIDWCWILELGWVKLFLEHILRKRASSLALRTCGCVGQWVEALVTLGGESSKMARHRRLAPKLVVSSSKFIATTIVCQEGTWSYSGKKEIAWPCGRDKLPQRWLEITHGERGESELWWNKSLCLHCIVLFWFASHLVL